MAGSVVRSGDGTPLRGATVTLVVSGRRSEPLAARTDATGRFAFSNVAPGSYRLIVERSGYAHNIRYVGYIPEEEMPLWYNAATLFVYPSEYEGFGLPPLEAMACGTPVVSSTASSLPEVVGDAGILVDPKDTDAIADAMHRVLDDETLRRDLSERGPVRASAFSWRRMGQETLAIYRAVSRQ